MEIKVMTKVSQVVVKSETVIVDVELPTTHKFYKKFDDSSFFGKGLVLFGMFTEYQASFLLFRIERNRQEYADFKPKKDCKYDDFLKSESDIRRTAWELMTTDVKICNPENVLMDEYVEITQEEFVIERQKLLNFRISNFI